jgi:hypothetical protein
MPGPEAKTEYHCEAPAASLDSYGLNREQKEFNKPQAASSSWMTLRMDASAL